jgi:hypothetical protein
MAVASVLVENGVAWSQVRVVACGDSDPVAPPSHDVTENYVNERVEIIQTRETLREGPSEGEAPASPGAGKTMPWNKDK